MKKPYFNVSIECIETDMDIVTASNFGANFDAGDLWQEGDE